MNVRRNGRSVHPRSVRATRWHRATHAEGGYLIVMTALALLPIMIFVSFSVDVGAWYARASKLQRTADAAALAAAVWMPDLTKATSVATATAAKNGISSGGNITITVAAVTGDTHKVKVTIVDSKAPQFFSRLLMGPFTITRAATARYEQSIPLGSPNNFFGTGDLMSGAARENLWAAVNGYCATKESGDPRLAYWDNSYKSGTGYECNGNSGAFVNPNYDPNGYIFEIKMPKTSVPTSVDVQVYDGAYDAGSASDPDLALKSGSSTTTTFKLYGTGNNTSPLSNTLLATSTANSSSSTWAGWKSVGTISNPCAECVYYLQVYTAASEANSYTANGFAVRAVQNGTWSACSTISGSSSPAYSAGCVQVYPREMMSVFANLSGTTATFWLASIDAAYAGKQMSVTLFDPGEGAAKIEILDPNGAVTNFNWTTPCNPPTAATGGCSGSNVAFLDPSPTGAAKPYTRLSSSSVYSDRELTLSLTLPANYATLYGTNTWWRIRYTVGSSATDRTTWGVSVNGSPVRLIEN